MNISGEHAVVIEESIDRRWVEIETSGSGLPIRPTHPYPKDVFDLRNVTFKTVSIDLSSVDAFTDRIRNSASRIFSRRERLSSWASDGQSNIHST